MSSLIAHIVELCIRRAWVVILAAGLLGCGCAVYAARHFAISTDVRKLLSPDLPWRQRELAYQAAFPQQNESILAVIEAPTPELASAAAAALRTAIGTRLDVDCVAPGTLPRTELKARRWLDLRPKD